MQAAGLSITTPRAEWRGKWVWAHGEAADRNAYALFRRDFHVQAAGVLEMAITADSSYALYLDGGFACRGPARAHLQYYSFDLLQLEVESGPHCLAVLAHHIGEVNATVMTGRPGLLADVVLRGSEGDGREEDLSTGPGWRCIEPPAWRRDSPCMMSHFGFWEDCDLRVLPPGWSLPGFDDTAWAAPTVIGTPPCLPWPRLCPRDIPLPNYARLGPPRATGWGGWRLGGPDDPIPAKTVSARLRSPDPTAVPSPFHVELEEGEGGRYVVVDFGRTVSGYVAVELAESRTGQCMEVSYDDFTRPDGTVDPARSYAHMTDRFILPGGECVVRTVHPRGFRYVMLDIGGVGPVTVAGITAVEETYPFAAPAGFACSDPALGAYYRKAAETVRICSTDAFTDCATRERVQWMEDLYVHSRVAGYAMGDVLMLRRALFQGAQNALPDGRINGFMPTERTNCAFASSSVAWLHLLVDYWLFAGNEDVARLLPTARRVIDAFDRVRDDKGLVASWPAGQFWDLGYPFDWRSYYILCLEGFGPRTCLTIWP